MNWKKVLKRTVWHSPRQTEEKHRKFDQDNLPPSRDLNTRPLKYEAGVLSIRQRYRFVR